MTTGPDNTPDPAARDGARGPDGSGLKRTSIIPTDEQSERTGGRGSGAATVIEGIPRLLGISDQVAGVSVKLDKQKVSIGRAPGNDIVIEDPSVSAQHAQLISGNGTWRVVNLVSANGTAVNGKDYVARYLSPNDIISFGRVDMRFHGQASGVRARAVLTQAPANGTKGPLWLWWALGAALLLVGAATLALLLGD